MVPVTPSAAYVVIFRHTAYLFSLRSTKPELSVLEKEPEKVEAFLDLHDVVVAAVGVIFFRVTVQNLLGTSPDPIDIAEKLRYVS